MSRKNTFVYAVCGDRHVQTVNQTIGALKRFSRSEVVVVRSRSDAEVAHDQVVDAAVPNGLDDHQASIFVKTSLPMLVGGPDRLCCYIDSDVVAVSDAADDVFRHRRGPVTFASDHIPIDLFSRHAVHCGCTGGRCAHLRQALHSTLDVRVDDPEWRHWNGGVFLYDSDSVPFMRLWHDMTTLIFEDPYWRTRDQGTLIAAVWKMGLQGQTPLPKVFNFVVDPYWGIPSARRPLLAPQEYAVNDEYSLQEGGPKPRPALLHLINGGVGKTGWKNWDDLARVMTDCSQQ